MNETFGLSDAVDMAVTAEHYSIIRQGDGPDFAGWLMDTYAGEDREYVAALSLSTLHGRYLEAR